VQSRTELTEAQDHVRIADGVVYAYAVWRGCLRSHEIGGFGECISGDGYLE
jgi:hypothetical protein